MSRATSRGLLLTPEEEISELQKHLTILEQERKTLLEESKLTSAKNKETITSLQTEKGHLRNKLKSVVKVPESEPQKPREEPEEILRLRRRFDQLRNQLDSKKGQLKSIKDKLSEIPPDQSATGEIPVNRQIRVLESRLDKTMIKYNEAQSIKKTYEQIVKQLKQERVAYDNQLAAIERSLRGKEHDFEELLLLSHDANHAKETAEAELFRVEAQVMVERMTRSRNVEEKKEEVHRRADSVKRGESDRRSHESPEHLSRLNLGNSSNADRRVREEKRKIKDYEEAFRMIKEATGVSDVNEVIQKFGTQEDTYKNLENLKLDHQKKIEKLTQAKSELKKQVEGLRFKSNKELENKSLLKQSEESLNKILKKNEKTKFKLNNINKTIENTMLGIDHISQILSGIKLEGFGKTEVSQDNLIDVLIYCQEKIKKIYFLIKETGTFHMLQNTAPVITRFSDTAQRTAAVLKAIYTVPEMANSYAQGFKSENRGRRRTEEELSEEIEQDSVKEKKENSVKIEKLSIGMRVRRATSAKKKRY